MLAQSGYYVRTTGRGIIFKDGWQTIDAVLNPDTLEFYSSKPPLLSTLIAGIYWILFHAFGWNLADNPATVVRAILLIVNAVPFAIYLWLLARIAESWGKSDWGKLFVVAAGAFATTVSPFLITLNNHTVAVFAVMFAWWSVLRIWKKVSAADPDVSPRPGTPGRGAGGEGMLPPQPSWYHFVSAGLFGAFAVTNELPALAFTTAIFLLFLWWRPARTLLFFLPAALIPIAAYFATNYAAVGTLRPVQTDIKGPWYQFEGSHWKILPKEDAKKGIDFAKNVESRGTYAMHVLIGHHGLFSLTPIWLLAVIGMLAGCWRLRDLWRQRSSANAAISPGSSSRSAWPSPSS